MRRPTDVTVARVASSTVRILFSARFVIPFDIIRFTCLYPVISLENHDGSPPPGFQARPDPEALPETRRPQAPRPALTRGERPDDGTDA
jgi:hypothetical protein